MTRPAPALTVMAAARAGWGAALLIAPSAILAAVTAREPVTAQCRAARVLGIRHLGQAALSLARPTAATMRLGTGIDALHAATCFGAALLLPGWRPAALADSAEAVTFAVAGRLAAPRP
jgi:hypothetical protein